MQYLLKNSVDIMNLAYIQLGNRLECYYNPNKLDIKGIGEDNTKLHEEYMIKFIKSFIRKMETEKPEVVIDFTKRFITQYKRKELEVEYYRSFNHESCYRLIDEESEDIFYDYWEEYKDELDISYNFHNVLLKLIQIPL